jgi:transmembrane 9 superfamily protein 2/4
MYVFTCPRGYGVDLLRTQMRLDEPCKVVCKIDALSKDQATAFMEKIDDEYRINM